MTTRERFPARPEPARWCHSRSLRRHIVDAQDQASFLSPFVQALAVESMWTRFAIALAALVAAAVTESAWGWNIGGHSPVNDLKGEGVTKAAQFALENGRAQMELGDGAGSYKFDQSCCRGCACLVGATKQVVAGYNWDMVLKFTPDHDNAQPEFRKVRVYDAFGKMKFVKSEKLSSKDASRNSYTQSAVDALTDPNAQSTHSSASASSSASSTGKGSDGSASDGSAYMDQLAKRNPMNLITHTISKPSDCSRVTKNGDNVVIHYNGTLAATGKKFDSSYDRNEPFRFRLGAGEVIQGWEKGIVGMCVGQKSRLWIPSSLAYGEHGFGSIIPGNAALVFDVLIVDIQ